MLKQLKYKFILFTVTIFGVIVLTVSSVLYYSIHNQMEKRVDSTLNHVLKTDENIDIILIDPFKIESLSTDMRWSFKITSEKKVVGTYYKLSDRFVNDILHLATDTSGYIEYNQKIFKYLSSDSDIAFVEITYDVKRVRETLFMTLLIGITAIILVWISSTLLANWAMVPIEEAWKSQKNFISDASHELRTPIATISANAQLLKEHPEESIQSRLKFINYIHDETRRMTELVERLLFLANSDDGKIKLNFTQINLSDLVYEVALPLESIAFEQEKELLFHINDKVIIYGDTTQIKQLIVILLDNAIKYSDKHEKIEITVLKSGILKIKNKGEIIPHDKLKYLFDRFYRVDESRQRDVSGYGLGLSIAKTITQTHKAKIHVTSNKEQGTIFTVQFMKGTL
ncbi:MULTISPECIES: cell wall metabolism sensor histidine kinase WalK [unclassified Granulicatella]|uniref:sensor histidine kinase n=1 Tax=unclassified Granulicatella TaxID=2630493 RepID=UPI0010749512|nr:MULTISPECIES: HAMP domain-containing sensor histidine kinase [unclassified Granulicatella]MBF0779722.1 hypothetical protein [Granulicatella sp. 19428wC4_WM01]TFU96242.1 hypothetical protein E4T68_01320 [Granulicatella sp. WM01]